MTITEQEFNDAMASFSQNGGTISTIDPKYALKGDLSLYVNKKECQDANLRSLLQIKRDDLIHRKQIYLNFSNQEGVAKLLVMQAISGIDDMIFIVDSIIQSYIP